MSLHTGWVAQLLGVSSPAPKGCGFDPQSGHILRSWVQPQLGVCTGGNWLMFLSHIDVSLSRSLSLCLSLSLSLLLSLKSINISSGEGFFFNVITSRILCLGKLFHKSKLFFSSFAIIINHLPSGKTDNTPLAGCWIWTKKNPMRREMFAFWREGPGEGN